MVSIFHSYCWQHKSKKRSWNGCMNEECGHRYTGYPMSHHSSTALRTHLQKQHKHAVAGSSRKAQWGQLGSVTWDITLSRPIQHCEGHNRQGWPFTHRLQLCPTWLCVTMQSSKHTQCSLQRFGGGLVVLASLLSSSHVHTVVYFMNINVMFT